MILVVDANVIFSALLVRQSATEDLFFKKQLLPYSPAFIWTEFSKYERTLLEKTNRSSEGFAEVLTALKMRVQLVREEEIQPFLMQATLVSPDIKDAPYFAACLKLNAGLWSNDKRLKKQNAVRVWSTSDLVELLG